MENNAQPQQAPLQGNVGVNPIPVSENQVSAVPAQPQPAEDHRTVLERIMGIFNRGKKEKVQDSPIAAQTPPSGTPPQQ